MGARPIALMNSLRFGELHDPRVRRNMEGVVAGIAGYGNSIGIPTVGGEIAFEECYAGNPLVNVFCLGIAKADEIIKGIAKGTGNPVYYVGAKTGRDGIHGATMASAEFDEKSAEKRPAVQVGDPFMEKLLLEACLEVMKSDALVGIQDMGAAGLTCSTCEMGSRGGAGIEIDVVHVPQREGGMTAYEIMLSESQERMLLVVKRGREREVEEIFEKWDLHAAHIGEVTADGVMRVRERGNIVAAIPTRALTDAAPVYRRPVQTPAYLDAVQQLSLPPRPSAPEADALRALLDSPVIANKRWVYRQYDHMVRTNTIVLPGMGAGVVRIKGTQRALALSLDGNGRYCFLDPYRGAMLAVAEAARNVACAGAEPIGATNCLNFGNPERPEIMWQFARSVEGISAACSALNIPITGGNVSLYNETDGRAIYPTPVLGVVGLLEDAGKVLGRGFRGNGDAIVLLGSTRHELGGSEYLKAIQGLVQGVPPAIDLKAEGALQQLLVAAARDGLLRSAHDCAEGGLAIALAECTFGTGGVGLDVDIPAASLIDAAPQDWLTTSTLFSESASRVVISVARDQVAALLRRAKNLAVPAWEIGRTGTSRIRVSIHGANIIDIAVSEAEAIWDAALDKRFTQRAA
jgi:phosphoribosylformylglycinamidine synthase